jgi:hypothetical protein
MSYLRLNYIGKSSLRLVIKENEKKEPDYITKYQYQSKIRQKPSSTPPAPCRAPNGNKVDPFKFVNHGCFLFFLSRKWLYRRMAIIINSALMGRGVHMEQPKCILGRHPAPDPDGNCYYRRSHINDLVGGIL